MTKSKKRKIEPKVEPEPEPEPQIQSEIERTIKQEEEEEQEQEQEETLFDEDEEEDNDDVEEEEEPETFDHSQNPQNAPEFSNPSPSTADPNPSLSDDTDDSSPESIRKLLEPFSKDLLMDLLRDAALAHPDVLSSVHQAADADPVHRKIFVHGLGWDTSVETLTAAFSKYGEIEDCNAVRDKISGKSKGYGFILFKSRSGAAASLKEPQKRIGNRMTACQLASMGPVPVAPPPAPPVSEYTQRKIYVSNVSADIDPQRLLQFFAKYGDVEEGPLGLDKQTGKPRGFALFVYRAVDSARKALEDPHKNFEGHILHCQRAIDGPKPNKPFHQHHGGARGSHFSRNDNNSNFMGGMGNHGGGAGHMMAPSPGGMAFNQGVPQAAAINPALGQALTALLATQGAGLGLTNLLGTFGSTGMAAPVNQSMPAQMANSAGHGMQGGYGNQPVGNNVGPNVMGGYGNQPGMQGGYPNQSMGQGNAGRGQQGVGHMGGVPPYMGH